MARGRPVFSQVRQNMIEIIAVKGKAYGYEIFKAYKDIFPAVTLRLMYYHLKKGVELGEFRLEKVVKEKGSFSWGGEVEKSYYSLGPKAEPKGDARVKKSIQKKR